MEYLSDIARFSYNSIKNTQDQSQINTMLKDQIKRTKTKGLKKSWCESTCPSYVIVFLLYHWSTLYRVLYQFF